MPVFAGRRVVLGVGGSVSAYKAAELARALVRGGARVRTLLTVAACRFIRPTLMAALTGEPAASVLFAAEGDRPAVDHVAWAEWAEVGIVAPATADLLAKLAAGLADDLLTTWLLAFPGPVVLAPAMNRHMWSHPAVRRNLEALRADGHTLVAPGYGSLAAGEGDGWGRLAEPDAILEALTAVFAAGASRRPPLAPPLAAVLAGRTVVVTAGPTREYLDPVRFLSNPSSGRMGYALAEVARDMGATVTLITGPVTLAPPPRVKVVRVVSAMEMRTAALTAAAGADVVLFAAAVSDWRPAETATSKQKKGEAQEQVLRLLRNPDISAEAGAARLAPVMVGFAAEAGAGVDEAERKLVAKQLDLVAFNDVREAGAGFAGEDNHVVLVDRAGAREEIGPAGKREVAARILARAAALLPGGAGPASGAGGAHGA